MDGVALVIRQPYATSRASAVDKSKSTDMIITGRLMDAAEAERSGLVWRVKKNDTKTIQ